MKNFNASYLIIFLSITLFSCCKDETKCQDSTKIECENYDPCYGKKAVSAAFSIFEPKETDVPDSIPYIDTDTVANFGRGVAFKALEEGAEYEWHLGSEVIKTRSFYRSGFPDNEKIPITLIVRKKPNNSCFPSDDGVDSLTRSFVQVDFFKASKVFGTFKGYFDNNKNDTATVKIYHALKNSGNRTYDQIFITNIISGCTDTLYDYFGAMHPTFKGVYDVFPYFCKRPKIWFQVKGVKNDSLVVQMRQEKVRDSPEFINRQFIGIRQ
jgi:hypothetical protein